MKSKHEILESLNGLVEEKSDEFISVLEDIDEAFTTFEESSIEDLKSEIESLNAQLETLDKEWREKYTTRFFSKPADEEETEEIKEVEEATSYDDLFDEKKEG